MTADARVLLREGPMSTFQIMVVVICTVLNMIDGFDVLAISFTAPVIAKEWAVNPATLGVLLSAGLAGMALVARFCCRPSPISPAGAVVGLSTAIISIGMLGSAATSNVMGAVRVAFRDGPDAGVCLGAQELRAWPAVVCRVADKRVI